MGHASLAAVETLLVAHQGGWDETLSILTPFLIFAALLWLANRRVNAMAASTTDESDGDPSGE